MSFRKGEEFSKRYQSLKSLQDALRRHQSKGYTFTAEGKAALELLEIIGTGVVLTGTAALTGAKIGSLMGPHGAGIGAAVGAAVGIAATFYAAEWYVTVVRHRNGTVTATFHPVSA